MAGIEEQVGELEAEQAELDEVLGRLSAEQWMLATPAQGWDVRDQVSHLADTNEIAYDTASGGPRALNEEASRYATPEEFTLSGCLKGRMMTPAEVLEWWRSSAARANALLRTLDAGARVPWGLGMSARMFATARLMEHWAHGLDVRAAVGLPPNASPRLRSIALIVTKAVPYALSVAGVEAPEGRTLRAELTFGDERWTIGAEDATDAIVGDALEYCRVGVQRMRLEDATTLRAEGELAELALPNLRAFL